MGTVQQNNMDRLVAACFLLSTAALSQAAEPGEERLGYYSVASDGSTSLTFNATSIQNGVILGLFSLVLAALILPLFGLSLPNIFGEDEAAYASESAYSQVPIIEVKVVSWKYKDCTK